MDLSAVADSFDRPIPEIGAHEWDVVTLTTELKNGTEEAYREFHSQYHQKLLRYCLALASGDDSSADEILQRTYLRICRNMKPLPNEAALWHWLIKAARCAMIDIARGRKRYGRLIARWGDFFRTNQQIEFADPDTDITTALDRAMAQLNDEQRKLIEAKYYDKERINAIAQRMDTTAKAIERKLARARKNLRNLIQKHLNEKR